MFNVYMEAKQICLVYRLSVENNDCFIRITFVHFNASILSYGIKILCINLQGVFSFWGRPSIRVQGSLPDPTGGLSPDTLLVALFAKS
jgi:hypothetical protein